MAVGFPTKANWAAGDILTAAQMDDLAGTLNLMNPATKGDLFTGSAANTYTKTTVGADGTVLTADAASTGGVKWATASGGGMTLLSTTSLTGSSVTITGISQSYTDLYVLLINAITSTSSVIRFDPNSTTGNGGFTTINGTTLGTTGEVSTNSTGTTARGYVMKITAYTGNDWNPTIIYGVENATPVSALGSIRYGTPISSIRVITTAGTFSQGTVKIYGVK